MRRSHLAKMDKYPSSSSSDDSDDEDPYVGKEKKAKSTKKRGR